VGSASVELVEVALVVVVDDSISVPIDVLDGGSMTIARVLIDVTVTALPLLPVCPLMVVVA
jgi:uncharacterized membrane protein